MLVDWVVNGEPDSIASSTVSYHGRGELARAFIVIINKITTIDRNARFIYNSLAGLFIVHYNTEPNQVNCSVGKIVI
jgi:hypothetical protein